MWDGDIQTYSERFLIGGTPSMHTFACFNTITIFLLLNGILALPYGCGGKIGVINVTKGSYHGLIWTCSGIDPGYPSLYQSGQNHLWAMANRRNASACANYCSAFYGDGMNAGVFFSNSTCQCWTYGDLNTSPSAASNANNATFLDFYETGSTNGPPAAVDWGVFTCPEGAYRNTVYQQGVAYGACYPLNIEPGQALLKECPSPGTRWESLELVNGSRQVRCYAKFSPLRISLNFSSPYTVLDIYDFTKHTSTKVPPRSMISRAVESTRTHSEVPDRKQSTPTST